MTSSDQNGKQDWRRLTADEDYRWARNAFRREKFDRAISLCRRILEAEPDSVPAFDLLAASLNRSGKLMEEIGALRSAADSGAQAPGHYGKLGELQRVAGDTGEAIVSLQHAADIDPDNPVTHVNLARALYDKGDHAAAEKQFKRALELDPRSVPAHHFLGNIHCMSENWGEAKQAFSTALDLDADYPPACLNLAELLFVQRKSEDRAADLERAAGLARHATRQATGSLFSGLLFYSLLLTGKILIELEQFAEATKILEEAGNRPEKHADLYVALSVTYCKLDERKKARAVSQRLMREFPLGSRLCANPHAEVLVLEPLYDGAFVEPLYGPLAYAQKNTIGFLPPDRVSLHHIFFQGINENKIASFKNKYDVVFNNVVNAEVNSRRGYGKIVRDILDRTGLPVVNSPDAVDLASRDKNYERLNKLDHLIFPKTVAFDLDAGETATILERAEAEFAFPVLVRRAESHGPRGLEKVDSLDALRDSLARFAKGPCYLTQYHESKRWKGNFLRYRAVFVGGRIYPSRMNLSENWLVGPSIDRPQDKKLTEASSEFKDEEKRWIADPRSVIGQANMAALHAVDGVLGLDCYGVDFGIAEDGQVIVFEANASMDLLTIRSHVAKFPYLRQAAEDIKSALEDLLIGKARGRG